MIPLVLILSRVLKGKGDKTSMIPRMLILSRVLKGKTGGGQNLNDPFHADPFSGAERKYGTKPTLSPL
jgi:hypothetical protein